MSTIRLHYFELLLLFLLTAPAIASYESWNNTAKIGKGTDLMVSMHYNLGSLELKNNNWHLALYSSEDGYDLDGHWITFDYDDSVQEWMPLVSDLKATEVECGKAEISFTGERENMNAGRFKKYCLFYSFDKVPRHQFDEDVKNLKIAMEPM